MRPAASRLRLVGAIPRGLVVVVLAATACAPATPAAPTAAPAASPAAAAKPIALPPPEQKRITLAHSTLEPTQLAYVMAREMGTFRKYGFDDVELVFAEGDAKTVQAIISGGADASAMGVGTVISSLVTDAPLITTAMTATTLTDSIVAAPDVKTPADLKGKTLAISAFGGTSHGAALIGLRVMGLTPQDVTITQVGGQSSRVAALRAGSVAAAVVDVALDDEMKAQGFNILAQTTQGSLEFGRNGMNLRRDWYEKNPNAALALTAAVLEGQNLIWTDTDKAIDVFQNWGQIRERSSAENQVREFMKYGRRDMRWSREGWELTREVLASTNPALQDVDVTNAYTFVPLDRLRELGLNQMLNIPATR